MAAALLYARRCNYGDKSARPHSILSEPARGVVRLCSVRSDTAERGHETAPLSPLPALLAVCDSPNRSRPALHQQRTASRLDDGRRVYCAILPSCASFCRAVLVVKTVLEGERRHFASYLVRKHGETSLRSLLTCGGAEERRWAETGHGRTFMLRSALCTSVALCQR